MGHFDAALRFAVGLLFDASFVVLRFTQVELRGGIPVGLWMGLSAPQVHFSVGVLSILKPLSQVMLLCIVGNMIPIPLLLTALRSERIKKLLTPLLNRAAQPGSQTLKGRKESRLKEDGAHRCT